MIFSYSANQNHQSALHVSLFSNVVDGIVAYNLFKSRMHNI